MSAHTPGPWVWRWKSGSLHQVGTERPFGATVLTPTYGYDEGIGVEISDADSRLIEAAPDLLEALILLEAEMVLSGNAESRDYGWKPAIEKTRAAIAKATGGAA